MCPEYKLGIIGHQKKFAEGRGVLFGVEGKIALKIVLLYWDVG